MEAIIRNIKIARLICRKFLLGLSKPEEQELEKLRKHCLPGYSGVRECGTADWQKLDERYGRVDIDGKWNAFQNRLQKRRKHKWMVAIGAAASVCLLLGTGTIIFLRSQPEISPLYTSGIEEKGVYLILSNGEKLSLAGDRQVLLHKVEGNATLHQNELEYAKKSRVNDDTEQNTLVIPAGAFYRLLLADGTRVWLNSETQISYPVDFVGDSRVVSVSGEAYFEVAKDSEKPFIVKTDYFDVKVLGTSFNINTYGDDGKVYTALEEGLVEISNGRDNTLLLKPGQVIELDVRNSGSIFRFSEISTEQLVAWKDGQFCFRKTPLTEILRQIERYYDVGFINTSAELQECYTGTISRNVSLEVLLSVLQESTDIKFKIDGRTVYIEKKRD